MAPIRKKELVKRLESSSYNLYPNIRFMVPDRFLHSGPRTESKGLSTDDNMWVSLWENSSEATWASVSTDFGSIREKKRNRQCSHPFAILQAPTTWCASFLGPPVALGSFNALRVSADALKRLSRSERRFLMYYFASPRHPKQGVRVLDKGGHDMAGRRYLRSNGLEVLPSTLIALNGSRFATSRDCLLNSLA
jgi:hypothetical protein